MNNSPSERSLGIAARCWCTAETETIEMDARLATAFAFALDRELGDASPLPENLRPATPTHLRAALERAINCFSAENGSNTPDFILADYLMGALSAFDSAVNERTRWSAPPAPEALAPQQAPVA